MSLLKKLALLITLISFSAFLHVPVTYYYNLYLNDYKASSVQGAYFSGRRIASTFQLSYKGVQYTVTNKHVCDPFNKIVSPAHIYAINESLAPPKFVRIGSYRRKILAISYNHDLCLLEGDSSKPALELAQSWTNQERIYLIGHPRGLPKIVRKGRIVALSQNFFPWLPHNNKAPYLLISTTTYPGNSGSPILNKWGNVVAVLFAGQVGVHTEAYAVPLESLKQFLKSYE